MLIPFIFHFVRLTSMNAKAHYTLPQSAGIAGGRPSSSYYFVGFQINNLFYLDLQHARATILLRRRNMSVGVGSRFQRGYLYRLHLPDIIIPRHHLRPTRGAGSSTFSYDGITIASIKTAINEQLISRKKRIHELELGGCQWWQIGTVGRG